MPRFKARIAEGKTIKGVRQGHLTEEFNAFEGVARIEGSDRVDAYINLYRQLAKDGKDVTVLDVPVPYIGFTLEDLERIRQSGTPIKQGTPNDGFQIETIEQVD